MPTYLIHGFRWDRINIRIHIVLNNLEEAAAECIMIPSTSQALLNSFYTLYDFLPPSTPPTLPTKKTAETPPTPKASPPPPQRKVLRKKSNILLNAAEASNPNANANVKPSSARSEGSPRPEGTSFPLRGVGAERQQRPPQFNDWSVVKLLEQYNPDDLTTSSQPYAFVADHVVTVDLSASLTEQINAYAARQRNDANTLGFSSPTPSSPLSPAVVTQESGSGTEESNEDTSAEAAGQRTSRLSSAGLSPTTTGGMSRDARRASRRLGWFDKLRDQLQKNAEIGWYVVVCGEDEDRFAPVEDLDAYTPEGSFDGVETPRGGDQKSDRPMTSKSARSSLRGFFKRRTEVSQD